MLSRRLATIVTVVLVIAFVVVAVAPAFARPRVGPSPRWRSARLLGSALKDGARSRRPTRSPSTSTRRSTRPSSGDGRGPQGPRRGRAGGRRPRRDPGTPPTSPEAPRDLPGREHRRPPGVRHGDLHDDGGAEPLTRPTASATPSPSAPASPAGSAPSTPPASDDASTRGRGSSRRLVVVTTLVAVVLGLARRSRTPGCAPAGDPATRRRRRGRAPDDGPGPLALTDFARTQGGC